MKKLIVIVLFALISTNTYSQATLFVGENFMNSYRNIKINNSKNSKGQNIAGTPFTTEDYVLGKIKGFKDNYLLRYDAFSDHMLVKRHDEKIVIINKEIITEVAFNDGPKYEVFDYNFDGEKKNGYLEVITKSSEISLLKKVVINFHPAEKPASGYDRPKPPVFKKGRDRYLITTKNGEVKTFSKKKDFVQLFPDQKNAIEKFIKSNKIKFTKEKDLIKLVEHLGSSL